MRLLLIEDDEDTAGFIVEGLRALGHGVHRFADGESGLRAATAGSHDIVILDRMLPGMSGDEVIARLRRQGHGTPILMLTARGSIEDRVSGLDAGADDYLVKPFARSELHARIVALARRGGVGAMAESITAGSIRIDRLRRDVTRGSERIVLQPREYQILDELARNVGRVVTRSMLLEAVWQFHFDPQTNIVETHISRLRAKLNHGFTIDAIETLRGSGYRLRDDA